MKVRDLKALLDTADPDSVVVLPVVRMGTIGATPATHITGGFSGFDWDQGRFLLQADSDLREIDRDEVKAIHERMKEADSPYKKLMLENIALRQELERLKK